MAITISGDSPNFSAATITTGTVTTLTTTTISDGTNSTSSTNPIRGSAKAWVNFNGNGVNTIRASYNVSSITRTGTGQYTVTFTSAFADTNYAPVMSGQRATTGGANQPLIVFCPPSTTASTLSTGSFFFACTDNGGNFQDGLSLYVSVFR
jgi:hypothetical protein